MSQDQRRPGSLVLLLALLFGAYFVVPQFFAPTPAPKKWEVEETPEAIDEASREETEPVAGVDLTNLGWKFDEERAREIVAAMGGERLYLSNINPAITASIRDQTDPVLMYRSMLEACQKSTGKPWRVHNQGQVGSCVGEGYATGVELVGGTMWRLGKLDQWRYVCAESIYGGSRVEAMGRKTCPGGDGSFGAAAFAWLTKAGGVVWRDRYPELGLDLLEYSESRARNWGYWGNGGQNDNGRLDAIARKSPIIHGALIRNWDELAAALVNSYPVVVCSNQGFTSVRDSQGFATPRGTWAHCMVFAAIRFDRPGVLCINSWGPNWISGPKWPEDQPDGSFWVDRRVVESMLRNSGFPDSYTLGDIAGFEARKIDHSEGWGITRGPNPKSKPGSKEAETSFSTTL